ncbi:MAG: hypothetical protein ACOYNH_12400 [Bacteroidia bacterium]
MEELIKHNKSQDLLLHVRYNSKKNESKSNLNFQETFKESLAILNAQKLVLIKIHEELIEYGDLREFILAEDFEEKLSTNNTVGIINFPQISKATFQLGKKEAMMLIYIMEKTNLICFENEQHRNNFLENNFNYIETRKNENFNMVLELKGVNSEFSKLKGLHNSDSNNATLKRLQKKLMETLLDFEFKKK